MGKINNHSCRNTVFFKDNFRRRALFAFLLAVVSVFALIIGCKTVTPIDPTGEYIFRDASAPTCPAPAYSNGNCSTCQTCPAPQRSATTWLGSSRDPNSTIPQNTTPLLSPSKEITELILGPTDPVARVGTYVVMVAGVKDRGGNYRKNKQVEWTIDCSSPGGFIDVDRRDWCDLFAGEWDPPRIENPRHAFTSTSRKPMRLTKGTTTPLDDVVIHEGQTWTAISSPCEGTTKLTAVALDSNDWQRRLRAAHIHWIDAWPILPPAKIAQNYSQTLNLQSTVVRANGSAALGCIAVYEIVSGGEDVEFKTDSENSNAEKITQIIVPVGGNGIAEAQLVKKSASAGQTKIRTTLIRDNSDGRFTVPIRLAQGETTVDWGETGLLISRSGPSIISGGTEAVYRITVRNVNSEKLNEIVVTDTVPESFEYQRSVPVGRVLDALVTNPNGTRSQKIQWTIPSLDSGQSQAFDVVYRPQYEGDYTLISTAQTGSVQAEDVMRTRVVASGGYSLQQAPAPTSTPSPLSNQDSDKNYDLDIQIVCQDRANIGSEVVMNVFVKNNGQETLTNILSSVTFSGGLCSSVGACPVQLKPIDYIEPGMTRDVRLTFTAIANGRQTINLELIAPNGQRFNRQVFVTVEGDACQTQAGAGVYPTDVNETPNTDTNSVPESDNSQNNLISDITEDQIMLNVTAPRDAKAGEEIQITLDIGNRSNNSLCNIRLACFLDSAFEIVRNTTGLVTTNPNKPYWDVLTPIPPQRGSRYYIVVKCKSAMPTMSSFVIQQGNTDLIKKDCQITVTQSSSLDTVPDATLPDNVDVSDPLVPIPDVSAPEPDTAPNPDMPSLDEPSLDVPSLDEPGADSLDVPAPDLPNLDVPDVSADQTSSLNDKINVEITTRRSSIKTNQTFTCQINLSNNTSETMNDVELAFYFPADSFKLIKLGTTGATQYDYNALGGFVTFKPATLEPGKTLKYYIRLLPQRNGITELSAAINAKESGTTDVRQNANITVNVE